MRITPSILNANLAALDAEIARIPSADGIHIDVMDNHFVPNLTTRTACRRGHCARTIPDASSTFT